MQVSLFNGFADKNPKPITIREVVEIIRADQRLQVLTENHRHYRAQGDTARADAEKQHMPCFSVAVLFSGGKQQKHIVSYTGMSIVDLDHIPSERMAEVLEMVRGDEHTLVAYTTISGQGVRILARYETPSNSPSMGRTQSSPETIPTNILEALPIEGELSKGLRGSVGVDPPTSPCFILSSRCSARGAFASPSSSPRRITDGYISPMCRGCCGIRLLMLTSTLTLTKTITACRRV